MSVDRIANWQKFSRHMEEYIQNSTMEKYQIDNGNGVDLMSIAKPIICIWHILRYSLRMWNGKMKENDIEKIAHYAEMTWTLSDGKVLEPGE